jgi:hypothetical protein
MAKPNRRDISNKPQTAAVKNQPEISFPYLSSDLLWIGITTLIVGAVLVASYLITG